MKYTITVAAQDSGKQRSASIEADSINDALKVGVKNLFGKNCFLNGGERQATQTEINIRGAQIFTGPTSNARSISGFVNIKVETGS